MRPLLVALALAALLPDRAAAACIYEGPLCSTFGLHDAVFDATLLDITGGGGRYVLSFRIEREWKGGSSGRVDVAALLPRRTFAKVGERYLVLASADPAGRLSTDSCRLRSIEAAAHDIAFLESLARPSSGARVLVTINAGLMAADRSVPASSVVISGPVQRRAELTAGGVEFADLPPGRYRIDVVAPPGFYAVPRDVQLPDAHACAWTNIAVRSRAAITGTVLTASGRPAAGIEIELAGAREAWGPFASVFTARTDARGRYAFSAVGLGDYVIGVNLRHGSTEAMPYARILHPSAGGNGRALALEAHAPIVLPPLRLPPPDRYITVTGRVRWPNGTPVERALVRATNQRDGQIVSDSTLTDSRGRFRLRVIAGLPHWIEGVLREPGRVLGRAETTVRPNPRTRPVLTLRASGSGQ